MRTILSIFILAFPFSLFYREEFSTFQFSCTVSDSRLSGILEQDGKRADETVEIVLCTDVPTSPIVVSIDDVDPNKMDLALDAFLSSLYITKHGNAE